MKEIDRAIEWALATAADSRYGYDQGKRWGPDYDCSSFVIAAFEYGGVPVKTNGATYTGNMRSVFLKTGFRDVTDRINRASGAGLVRGDVLLNEIHHTAIFLGQGQVVEAASNELGGILGGVSGDQTGWEIATRGYYNYPWDCVLRLGAADGGTGTIGGSYTVAAGDSLWAIAARLLGDGRRYSEIMEANGLTGTVIRPGMSLRIPGTETPEPTIPAAPAETVSVSLPMLQKGSTGSGVGALRALLRFRGAALSEQGETFGAETDSAVRSFQTGYALEVDGIVGPETWGALLLR